MNECYLTKEDYPKFYCYNIHDKLDIETEHKCKYKIGPIVLRKRKIKVWNDNNYFSEYERKKHQKEICLTMFNYYNPTNVIYGDKKNKQPWIEWKYNRFKTLINAIESDGYYQQI